jgi:hypothetical protein
MFSFSERKVPMLACCRPLAIATVTVVALLALAAPAQQPTLAELAWLEGEWIRATSSGTAIERWKSVPGGGLVGEGAFQRGDGGAEIQTEALLLVEMAGEIFYVAKPRENTYPVAFRLTSLENGTAVFENPTHDFPQRIIYRRSGPDSMTAAIEGPGDGGQPRRIEFPFVRR